MSDFVYPYYEVAIVGDDFNTKRVKFTQKFHPNILLLGGKDEGTLELLEQKFVQGKTMIYVCEDKNCKLPVEDITAAEEQLQ
jgi:hypothetical protein